jgi:general secretion pathway protein D
MRTIFRVRPFAAACIAALLVAACATPRDPTIPTPGGAAGVPASSAAPSGAAPDTSVGGAGGPVSAETGQNVFSGSGALLRSGALPDGGVGAPRPKPRAGSGPTVTVTSPSGTTADSGARYYKGSDEVLAPARPRVARVPGTQDVSFKFEQAPVREVVHAVLGELMGFTYVIHQPVAGTVTVSTAAPVPADQALSVLESMLQANGLLMAQDAAGVFHVGSPDALRGIVPAPKRIEMAPLPPGYGTVIVPLKYIGAAEMADILRPIARPEAVLRVDNLRNLLVLVGSRNQIDGWLEIVRTFDVDLLKGMSVGVFPLQYASVREIESALRSMVSPGEAGTAPAAAGAARAQAPAPAQGSVEALPRHPLFGALRIIPLERMNSLIVITPRAAYLDEIRVWIERLDRPGGGSDVDPRLFIYQVQNGSATHLANVLNGLFGTGSVQGAGGDSGVAPGLRAAAGATSPTSRTIGATPQSAPLGGTRAGAAAGFAAGLAAGAVAQSGTRAAGTTGVTATSLPTGVRIIGDDLNNAVLIFATPLEFVRIEEALKRLDAPATQVIIEATIVEVSLVDDLQYGLQWYFTDTMSNGYTGQGQLNLNRTGPILPVQPGFAYSLINSVGQIRVVLNMLAERSLIRVISSPSVMVLDNHTAAIQVGDQQPIRSSETVTVGGNVTTSIEYKDTGVLLAVTPSVNSGDMVSMTINQSITDVGPIDVATGQRAFLNRQIGSRVAVRSGEALVLGGLIRDSVTDGSSGIPLLSRIPVLGALFGAQTRNGNRTELLVVITPRVVRTSFDAREVSAEMRDRMRGFRALVDQQKELLPKPFLEQLAPPKPFLEPLPARPVPAPAAAPVPASPEIGKP